MVKCYIKYPDNLYTIGRAKKCFLLKWLELDSVDIGPVLLSRFEAETGGWIDEF